MYTSERSMRANGHHRAGSVAADMTSGPSSMALVLLAMGALTGCGTQATCPGASCDATDAARPDMTLHFDEEDLASWPDLVPGASDGADDPPDLVTAPDLRPRPDLFGVPLFAPPVHYPVGAGPLGLTAADVNGDKKLDLAVANSNTVSVLLGGGNGTFKPAISVPVGTRPQWVTAADLDHDGRVDLAVPDREHQGRGTLNLLVGDGAGNFKPGPEIRGGALPQLVTARDLNRDAVVDLVVAGGSIADIPVLNVALGRNDGTFGAPVPYRVDVVPGVAQGFVLQDLNGDKLLDLAVAKSGDYVNGRLVKGTRVGLMLGAGDGTFGTCKLFPAGDAPLGLVSADFDRDGRMDLIAFNHNSSAVTFLHGLGNGTFRAPVQQAFAPVTFSTAIATADFNGDGNADLALAATQEFQRFPVVVVAVALGNGDGTFQPLLIFPAPDDVYWLVVGDFNADQRPDIAATAARSDQVAVLINTGG